MFAQTIDVTRNQPFRNGKSMHTITIVQLYRIKSLRGLRAGGRARATAGAKWAGDASSMAAVNAAQPISRRESGHRRHSTVILRLPPGEWRRCFRRLPDFIVAILREETKQVASQCNGRAPKSFLDDCELWFDITQNDGDGDGLTWWEEVNVYGTDPTVRNERYAVLISHSSNVGIEDEFWNELKIMYDILINEGYLDDNEDGFDPTTDHLVVLYAGYDSDIRDGKYGVPTGESIVDGYSNKDTIQSIFSTLGDVMSENDFLFVYHFHHGQFVDQDGDDHPDINEPSTIWIAAEYLTDVNFANYVDQVQHYGRRTFVLGACYSGGFIDNLENDRTIVVTACRYDEVSWVADDQDIDGNPIDESEPRDLPPNRDMDSYHHAEFLYHFQSALREITPQGTAIGVDTNGNGYISIIEAFNYAYAHHSSKTQHYIIGEDGNPYSRGPETPQLSDIGGLGENTYL